MSTLRLTTIANQGNTASVPSETVINGSAKAWINFNGTSTVAIRASFNVTSITDNGTGDYTINYTTAMPDTNYCPVSLNRSPGVASGFATQVDVYNTGSTRILTLNSSVAAYDPVQVSFAIFR